jgi:hypothetical protein
VSTESFDAILIWMGLPAFVDTEERDSDRFARMTPEQRLVLFFELCDLTDSIVAGRPDPAALRAPAPRSAESEALWQRLMKRER